MERCAPSFLPRSAWCANSAMWVVSPGDSKSASADSTANEIIPPPITSTFSPARAGRLRAACTPTDRRLVGHRSRHLDQLRSVRDHCLRPAARQRRAEAQHHAGPDVAVGDAAAQAGLAGRAARTRGIEAADGTTEQGLDGNPVALFDPGFWARLHHAAEDLVAQHAGKR